MNKITILVLLGLSTNIATAAESPSSLRFGIRTGWSNVSGMIATEAEISTLGGRTLVSVGWLPNIQDTGISPCVSPRRTPYETVILNKLGFGRYKPVRICFSSRFMLNRKHTPVIAISGVTNNYTLIIMRGPLSKEVVRHFALSALSVGYRGILTSNFDITLGFGYGMHFVDSDSLPAIAPDEIPGYTPVVDLSLGVRF